MACARCGGLMILEGLLDESGLRIRVQAERCLNCGYLEDSVIFANHAASSSRVHSRQVGVKRTHERAKP
jgi:hypothetical protein